MKGLAKTQTKLRKLAEERSLPESRCSHELLRLLGPLLDSGVQSRALTR